MRKILISIQAIPDTRDQLKQLAKKDRRSMARYLEVLIDNEHKKIFPQTTDSIIGSISQTNSNP